MRIAVQIFRDVLKKVEVGPESVYDEIIKHPVLLSPSEWDGITEYLKDVSERNMHLGKKILHIIRNLHNQFDQDLLDYPFGQGPIETIYKRLGQGEVTLAAACNMASRPENHLLLSPLYVKKFTKYLGGHVTYKSDVWPESINMLKILFAALEGFPNVKEKDGDYFDMWSEAVLAWVYIVTFAVCDIPDGRLFYAAVRYGKALADCRNTRPDAFAPVFVLKLLGVLYLEPYVGGRNSQTYSTEYKLWQSRLFQHYGTDIQDFKDEEIRMPVPLDALRQSVHYLEKAVPVLHDVEKAWAIKALVTAYFWIYLLDGEYEKEKICYYGNYAFRLFVPESEFFTERVTIMQTLKHCNCKIDKERTDNDWISEIDALRKAPIDDTINKYGLLMAVDVYNKAISEAIDHYPEAAIDLWQKNEEILQKSPDENILIGQDVLGLQLIRAILSDNALEGLEDHSIEEQERTLLEQGHKERWTSQKLAASRVIIATGTPKYNQEQLGVSILQEVLVQIADDPLLLPFQRPIFTLKASLHVGSAVNLIEANKIDEATSQYFRSLKIFLYYKHKTRTLEVLGRIYDMALHPGIETAKVIIANMLDCALELEKTMGFKARELLQHIYRVILQNIVENTGVNPILICWFLQLAKGLNVAAVLQRKQSWRLSDKPQLEKLLGLIELSKQNTDQNKSEFQLSHQLLDEAELLTAYAGEGESREGLNVEDRLANLQRQFDNQVHTSLLDQALIADPDQFFLQPRQLQSLLGPRTVLLCQYQGSSPFGTAAFYSLVVTKEDISFIGGMSDTLPGGDIIIGTGELAITSPILGGNVSEVRKQIQEDPQEDDVLSNEGGKTLESEAKRYFGGEFMDWLKKFKAAGKDHLCIVPHGPYHYFPFHLLGPMNTPLAEDWIVTYLPNISLLKNKSSIGNEKPNVSFNPLASFGLSYRTGNTYKLSILDNAVQEAHQVAAAFGTTAFVEDMVTEKALLEALLHSKRVHIAVHGLHNVVAPSFQCIYLSPDEASDGILNAYELIGLDLSGLDLITLSACETALGRFDIADNIRGLPANLLIAGAATIIGTLWDAETYSCEVFFVTLYQKLKEGKSKLEAFHAAQKTTRKSFPQYRDWGAFYMVGNY